MQYSQVDPAGVVVTGLFDECVFCIAHATVHILDELYVIGHRLFPVGVKWIQRVPPRPRYGRPILKLIVFNFNRRFSPELLSSVFNHKN